MSWLSRAINLIIFSVIFYPTKCIQMHSIKFSSFDTPSRNGHLHLQMTVTCRRWTAFSFNFKLFPHCRHFIHRFARVPLPAHLCSAKNCALMLKKKKLALGPLSNLPIPDQWQKIAPISALSRPAGSDRGIPN